MYPAVLLMYFISAAVILLASLALIIFNVNHTYFVNLQRIWLDKTEIFATANDYFFKTSP